MVNQPNTIYEIRYDFDLDGKTINLPTGSILFGKYGQISNGIIKVKSDSYISNISFNQVLVLVYACNNTKINNCNFIINSYEDKSVIDINNSTNISVLHNICYLYNKASGISSINSKNILIQSNNIEGKNIDITQDYTYFTSGISINYENNNINIANNFISFVGLGISCTAYTKNMYNIKINNNTINDVIGYGINLYKTTFHVEEAIISNNNISRVSGTYLNPAINNDKTMGGGIYIQGCENIICHNNYIKENALFTDNFESLAPAAIGCNESNKVQIIGNHVANSKSQGIILDGEFCICSNNLIESVNNHGIQVRKSINSQIVNNIIKDCNNYGILLQSKNSTSYLSNIKVSTNVIINTKTAINVDNINVKNIDIIFNTINDYKNYGIILSAEKCSICHNKFIQHSSTSNECLNVVNDAVCFNNDFNDVIIDVGYIRNTKNPMSLILPVTKKGNYINLQLNNSDNYAADNKFVGPFVSYEISENGKISGLKNCLPGTIVVITVSTDNLEIITNDKKQDGYFAFRLKDGINRLITKYCILVFMCDNYFLREIFISREVISRSNVRPILNANDSYVNFIDLNLQRQIYWSGSSWRNMDGHSANIIVGDSNNIPTIEPWDKGFQYFNTTLNKPIWWTGSKWVDATGADVDAVSSDEPQTDIPS